MSEKQKQHNQKDTEQEEKSFEDHISRLEEIVSLLEKGELPLDKSLELHEEGLEIYRRCNKMLQEAESRIYKLIETLDGALEEKPLKLEDETQTDE
jgi:exodeoxyribonuclease VII small subunit